MQSVQSLTEIAHEVPLTAAVRVGLALAGLFAIIMPGWELGRGLWPLKIITLFYAVITLGAWFVGGFFLLAALTGAALR
jgi:hypothetical protein